MTTVYAVGNPYGPSTYHDTEREAERHSRSIRARYPDDEAPVYAVDIHDQEEA